MIRRYLWMTIVFTILVSASACESWRKVNAEAEAQAKARDEAMQFWAAFSQPTTDNLSKWGMRSFRIFGRSELVSLMAAGGETISKAANAADTYEVIIPFWCKGENVQGQPVKFKRELAIKVARPNANAPWQAQSHEFRNEAPLTFGRQALSWSFWSLIAPFVIFFLLMPLVIGERSFGCAVLASVVLTLPLVGHVGYVCFGSGIAVAACLAVYIIINLLYLRLRK